MLSEENQARIRSEEIYREEVRKEIEAEREKSLIPSILNQPFVLWFLSSVLIGFLSFAYTQWREHEDSRVALEGVSRELASEIRFRVRQMDSSIEDALEIFDLCAQDISANNGKINGGRIRDALESAKLITVTTRLGGIIQFTLSDEDSVNIGSSGYAQRSLLFKRGYKDVEFKNDNIADLAIQHASTIGSKATEQQRNNISDLLEQFEIATAFQFENTIQDWRKRHQAQEPYETKYGGAYRVYEVDVDDYGDRITEIGEWVNKASVAWQRIKSHDLIAPASE